ncbi:hypothetical protein [Prevotella sp. KH2C16]|uniref:hypothetical protein n=1 Tax=Prevotella sp. KH2C16 TaxID=1855325 RepID=UPI0008F349A7|nr:hypothetical protein [Prevotella sp. KH2C16]SFG23023.1 hypothetical protein SAMN05216383_107123 [Prevotella sp. KH2C16]
MKSLLSFVLMLILAGCGTRNATTATKSDSKSMLKTDRSAAVSDTVYSSPAGVTDTIIGAWRIHLRVEPNELVIDPKSDYPVRDNSAFLTLYYNNKLLCKDKELRTKTFVGKEGVCQLQGVAPLLTTDNTLYLQAWDCEPETDACWNMLYCYTPGRKPDLYVLTMEVGDEESDIINSLDEFMTLYLHQKKVAQPTVEQLKPLFEQYLRSPLISRLLAGGGHADDELILQGHSPLTMRWHCGRLRLTATPPRRPP